MMGPDWEGLMPVALGPDPTEGRRPLPLPLLVWALLSAGVAVPVLGGPALAAAPAVTLTTGGVVAAPARNDAAPVASFPLPLPAEVPAAASVAFPPVAAAVTCQEVVGM